MSRLEKMRAIDALEKDGSPAAVKQLLALHDDPDESPIWRNMALESLSKIGTAEVADALEARLDGYPSKRGRKVVAKRIAKIRQSL